MLIFPKSNASLLSVIFVLLLELNKKNDAGQEQLSSNLIQHHFPLMDTLRLTSAKVRLLFELTKLIHYSISIVSLIPRKRIVTLIVLNCGTDSHSLFFSGEQSLQFLQALAFGLRQFEQEEDEPHSTDQGIDPEGTVAAEILIEEGEGVGESR